MSSKMISWVFAAFAICLLASPPAQAAGQQCGGFVGLPCRGGEFCQMKPTTCGFADLFGTCTRVPRLCPRIFRPVCGCDGKTYPNECELRRARMSKAHDGRCWPF